MFHANAEDLTLLSTLRKTGKVVIDWNFVNSAGQTALFYQHKTASVTFLVRDCGLSVNHISRAGVTPAYAWACRHVDAVLDRSSHEFSVSRLREHLQHAVALTPSVVCLVEFFVLFLAALCNCGFAHACAVVVVVVVVV